MNLSKGLALFAAFGLLAFANGAAAADVDFSDTTTRLIQILAEDDGGVEDGCLYDTTTPSPAYTGADAPCFVFANQTTAKFDDFSNDYNGVLSYKGSTGLATHTWNITVPSATWLGQSNETVGDQADAEVTSVVQTLSIDFAGPDPAAATAVISGGAVAPGLPSGVYYNQITQFGPFAFNIIGLPRATDLPYYGVARSPDGMLPETPLQLSCSGVHELYTDAATPIDGGPPPKLTGISTLVINPATTPPLIPGTPWFGLVNPSAPPTAFSQSFTGPGNLAPPTFPVAQCGPLGAPTTFLTQPGFDQTAGGDQFLTAFVASELVVPFTASSDFADPAWAPLDWKLQELPVFDTSNTATRAVLVQTEDTTCDYEQNTTPFPSGTTAADPACLVFANAVDTTAAGGLSILGTGADFTDEKDDYWGIMTNVGTDLWELVIDSSIWGIGVRATLQDGGATWLATTLTQKIRIDTSGGGSAVTTVAGHTCTARDGTAGGGAGKAEPCFSDSEAIFIGPPNLPFNTVTYPRTTDYPWFGKADNPAVPNGTPITDPGIPLQLSCSAIAELNTDVNGTADNPAVPGPPAEPWWGIDNAASAPPDAISSSVFGPNSSASLFAPGGICDPALWVADPGWDGTALTKLAASELQIDFGATPYNTGTAPTWIPIDIRLLDYQTSSTTDVVASEAGDSDDAPDAYDNCSEVDQTFSDTLGGFCDADNDGIGNLCFADYDGDGTVTFADAGIFGAGFGMPGNTDFDCDGTTTFTDAGLFGTRFGMAPGPSGVYCAGTIPCPVPSP